MFLATNYDKQPLLEKIEGVINNLFHSPMDAFYTGRAMDLLFDGVPFDCSNKGDTGTAAVCMQLEQNGFRKVNESHLKFSMFGSVILLPAICRGFH